MKCQVTLDQLVDMLLRNMLVGKSVKVFRPNEPPLFCDVVAVRFNPECPDQGKFSASESGPWYMIAAILKVY